MPPPSGTGRDSGRAVAVRGDGKVLTTENARAIVRLDEPIRRRDLEQIVPYPTARDIVLEGPPDVVAYECMCCHRDDRNTLFSTEFGLTDPLGCRQTIHLWHLNIQ